MAISTLGDVVLRGSVEAGYTLVDLLTGEPLSEAFSELEVAVAVAIERGAATIWRENLDNRGRPVGPLAILIKQQLQN